MYNLPHPSQLLTNPPVKNSFKTLVRKHVIGYWESLLRKEAEPLTSLAYFKPVYMSISSPHRLWASAGSSPSKIAMATVQAVMLSGRYRTEALCSHWSKNRKGICLLSPLCANTVEDLPHILSICPALSHSRHKLLQYTREYSSKLPDNLKSLLLQNCSPSNPTFSNFLLDCSTFPAVISIVQLLGAQALDHLFSVTRTWVHVIHRERMKLLGRWNPI